MATKKKARQPGEKSPAQKAADTMRKRRLEAAAKKKPEKTPGKPLTERPDVKVTPYPRTGDNADFEGVLDRVGLEAQKPKQKEPGKEPAPAEGTEILTVADVAEWVGWPFLLWSQANELPGLALTPKEAQSLAEPVTAILNRHGTGRVIPPDYVDALRAGARLTPIMGDRLHRIKKERQRRAAAGGDNHDAKPFVKKPGDNGSVKVQQGATATKPKEV